MTESLKWLAEKVIYAVVPVLCGALWKIFLLSSRVDTIEQKHRDEAVMEAKKAEWDTARVQQRAELDKQIEARIAVLERLVLKLELIPDTLHNLSSTMSKIDALSEASARRVEFLENTLYQLMRHQMGSSERT